MNFPRPAAPKPSLPLALAMLCGLAVGACAVPVRDGFLSSGPRCPMSTDVPEWRSVWLGHFSGGARAFSADGRSGLAWRDEYACFPSRASCEAWQKSMRREFHAAEGYRSCVFIRSGPLSEWSPVVPTPIPDQFE
jgi:hypothetical protein